MMRSTDSTEVRRRRSLASKSGLFVGFSLLSVLLLLRIVTLIMNAILVFLLLLSMLLTFFSFFFFFLRVSGLGFVPRRPFTRQDDKF